MSTTNGEAQLVLDFAPAEAVAAGTEREVVWQRVRLPEVVEINPPRPAKDDHASDMPVSFVPMAAVSEETGRIEEAEDRPFGEVRSSYTAFAEGDLIWAKITPCMENGKAAVARGLTNGLGFGSTEFHVLRPGPDVLAEYLFYFVRQESIRKEAEANMTGSVGQRRVPTEFLEEMEIPLPPVEEQVRIVARLEALVGRIRRTQARLEGVPTHAQRLREAVLAAACSGRLTEDWRAAHTPEESPAAFVERLVEERRRRWADDLRRKGRDPERAKYPVPLDANPDFAEALEEDLPEGWALVSLDELAFHVTSGSRGWAKYYADDGPFFIRAQNINTDALDISDAAYVRPPADSAEAERTRVELGDLLITITGANVTKAAYVDRDLDEAYINQHVALVRPVNLEMHRYLHLWTISPQHGRRQLQEAAYGAGKPGLNLTNVKELAVALPPMEEQREIVRRAERLLALAGAVEHRARTARAQTERLAQGVLDRAFSGNLLGIETAS